MVNTQQLTLPVEEAPANSVPAAAVIMQALIGITGRKCRRRSVKSDVKSPGSTWEAAFETGRLESVEGVRIPGVAVKCVEFRRIPVAKAAPWTKTDAQVRKRGEQTGLDTLVVHAVNDVYLEVAPLRRSWLPELTLK